MVARVYCSRHALTPDTATSSPHRRSTCAVGRRPSAACRRLTLRCPPDASARLPRDLLAEDNVLIKDFYWANRANLTTGPDR